MLYGAEVPLATQSASETVYEAKLVELDADFSALRSAQSLWDLVALLKLLEEPQSGKRGTEGKDRRLLNSFHGKIMNATALAHSWIRRCFSPTEAAWIFSC